MLHTSREGEAHLEDIGAYVGKGPCDEPMGPESRLSLHVMLWGIENNCRGRYRTRRPSPCRPPRLRCAPLTAARSFESFLPCARTAGALCSARHLLRAYRQVHVRRISGVRSCRATD